MNITKLEPIKNIEEYIDELVNTNNIDYIDAILTYCQDNNLDIEFVGEIVAKSPALKSKVQLDAERLHFIKKTSRLPLN